MVNQKQKFATDIISADFVVDTELSSLGLSKSILQDAVLRGQLAKRSVTKNHPPIAGGSMAYFETVCALRDKLLPLGWVTDNSNNLCITRHASGECDLIVSTGDQNTGRANGHPTTKNPKGNLAKNYIENNQLSFLGQEFDVVVDNSVHNTWMLIYFFDHEEDEVRLELSIPTSIDEQGYVTQWQKRILIEPISFEQAPNVGNFEPEYGPDVNIDVTKVV